MNSFSELQQLPPIALFRVFSRILKTIVSQFWPLAIAYFFQVTKKTEESQDGGYMLILIYVILGLTVANGIIRYFTFRWGVDGDALIIRHGVFKKVNLRIPFERIQSVDLQQPWYYKIGGAVRFIVDTAGSKSKEAEIWALKESVAEELRAHIYSFQGSRVDSSEPGVDHTSESKVWIFVNNGTLAKIGLFRNHFRSIAAFMGGGFYLYSQLQEFISSDEINREIGYVYDILPKVFGFFLLLGLFIVFAAMAFSVILTVFLYYNFTVIEKGDAFLAKYGLINSKARQIRPAKIQIMRTEQGPVFKFLGILKFKIEQAYAQKNQKEDFSIPGSPVEQVQLFRERIFGTIGEHVHTGASFQWFWYRVIRLGVLPALIPIGIFFLTNDVNYLWGGLILPVQVFYSFSLWKNQGMYLDEEKLSVRRKIIFDRRSVLQLQRVQAVQIRESWYQRRKGLATLVVETAGGSVNLPFISKENATQLANFLLFKSETSRVEWM